jgi:hypothetical protein
MHDAQVEDMKARSLLSWASALVGVLLVMVAVAMWLVDPLLAFRFVFVLACWAGLVLHFAWWVETVPGAGRD